MANDLSLSFDIRYSLLVQLISTPFFRVIFSTLLSVPLSCSLVDLPISIFLLLFYRIRHVLSPTFMGFLVSHFIWSLRNSVPFPPRTFLCHFASHFLLRRVVRRVLIAGYLLLLFIHILLLSKFNSFCLFGILIKATKWKRKICTFPYFSYLKFKLFFTAAA